MIADDLDVHATDLGVAPAGMIDFRAKGFPVLDAPLDPARIAGLGWNLFDGRFMLPVMAMRESALDHNIVSIADWCASVGVDLAPHGKTVMSPEIFRRQLEAGAWAITFGTPWQARVGAQVGVPRLLIANQVVDPAGIDWLASTLDDGPEVYCWVDSVAGVDLLDARLGAHRRRLPVLVEVGFRGGRTGVRDFDAALAVARRVASSSSVRLAGVSFYEGLIKAGALEERLARVSDLLALVRQVAMAVAEPIRDGGGAEIILTGGGSRYTDLVARVLAEPLGTVLPTRAVLRCGSTVTHDDGGLDAISPFGPNGLPGGPRLRAALEVWAPVLSMPEPGLALVGAGKRDLSTDWDVPPVLAIRGQDGVRRKVHDGDLTATNVNDQHTYLAMAPGLRLAVGDLVAMGVRHPCTGMDRWKWLPLIDDGDDVIDALELIF